MDVSVLSYEFRECRIVLSDAISKFFLCPKNLFFHNRIEAAVDVFNAGKAHTILVSGDNHVAHYNEPQDMKNALVEHGIPEARIVCDYAGFSTLDSVVRAKEIFGQNTLIVISQEFHNRRAIFIGKQRGLELVGYNAREVNALNSCKTKLREELARVKTLLDIWVLDRQPKFLGDPILISSN
jgi:SanA protein